MTKKTQNRMPLAEYIQRKKAKMTPAQQSLIVDRIKVDRRHGRDGDCGEIARYAGCVPTQVAWVKAHMTMGKIG